MKVSLSLIQANPYRDMDKYPISESKVKALLESIRQTDFWDNLLARPAGNQITLEDGTVLQGQEMIEYLRDCEDADFPVELAYGHHRWVAVEKTGMTEIDIPVKSIEDEVMLKIMANENKGDWASNMSVILETVRQVRNTLHNQAASFESFDDYLEVYSFFATQKEWKAALDVKNIGYRRICKFLGETWSENDVRAASSTLDAIDGGLFEQEQVIYMPSIAAMNRFQALAKAIHESGVFPEFFKRHYVAEAADIICDAEKGATVLVIQKAAAMVRKNNIPGDYLRKQKVTPFDLVKELKRLATDPDNEINPDDFLKMDGLSDWEGIDEAVAKVKESIKRDDERRERAGGADAPDSEEVSDEAQAAIDAAEAEVGEEVDAGLPPLEDVDVDATADALATVFVQSSKVFTAQTERMIGNVDDLDPKVESVFGTAFEDTFKAMAKLGLNLYGKADLVTMLTAAERELTD
jgi:hypothetical protein